MKKRNKKNKHTRKYNVNLNQLIAQLESLGAKPGIVRVKNALRYLKRPDRKYHVIKVGGTNGKGSTSAYMASILNKAGYKVGLFTSPHLMSYFERYKINGYDISKSEFTNLLEYGLELASKFELTTFETLTIMAFVYFARKKCDYVVMEVGMGGRLDAVNVARETLSIITNISLEHTQHLGKKIKQIAYEKAGIINYSPVITGATGKALEVIQKRAKKRRVPLLIYAKDFNCENIEVTPYGTSFTYVNTKFDSNMHIKLKMIGKHQAVNAGLAIAGCEVLGIERSKIIKGIGTVKVPGRIDYIKKKLRYVVDVSHNPDGIAKLVETLPVFNAKKKIGVCGIMKDKDIPSMVRQLSGVFDDVIVTYIDTDRCADPNYLKDLFESNNVNVISIESAKNVGKKLNELYKNREINRKDLIVLTGSIYIIGQIIPFLI